MYKTIAERRFLILEELAYAELDRISYKQGYIQALVDILDTDFAEESE